MSRYLLRPYTMWQISLLLEFFKKLNCNDCSFYSVQCHIFTTFTMCHVTLFMVSLFIPLISLPLSIILCWYLKALYPSSAYHKNPGGVSHLFHWTSPLVLSKKMKLFIIFTISPFIGTCFSQLNLNNWEKCLKPAATGFRRGKYYRECRVFI
jgi:hypothetical protein